MTTPSKLNCDNLSIGELINLLIDVKEFNDRKILLENDSSYVDIKHFATSRLFGSKLNKITSISRITFHYIHLNPIRNWMRELYWLDINDDLLLYYPDLSKPTKVSIPTAERVKEMKAQIIEEINKY